MIPRMKDLSDHEVRLAAEDAVDEVLRKIHRGRSLRVEVGGIDATVDAPGTKMPPAAGSFGFAGQHWSRAAIASNCREALSV